MLEIPDDDLARLLFLSEEPARASLILVFGSADLMEGQRRAQHAIQLHLAGYAPRVLLSGGDPVGRGSSEAVLMAREAIRQGVPENALFLEDRSNTTAENVLFSRSLLAQQGYLADTQTMLLVSAWWHLRRARVLAARAFGPGVRLIACAAEGGDDPTAWARSPEGRRCLRVEQELLAAIRP